MKNISGIPDKILLRKTIFVLALLMLHVSVSYAAVSVETFTCNGMSGTVVVENGATFSCQASIKNEDTQNSANIGSVSLLVDGNWAERTSYTGSDFSTTLTAGASTTATFSGMKVVSPGATNKFQSIQIDSASDTTVANTNVNVIVIKSLTVSASASSATQSSEFDVSATAVAGGDLGSATLTWSGSGGCAVSSGYTATKNVGSLPHNAETTGTWRIIQGSSDCINTITASGASSSVTTTKSKSSTVSVIAGGSSSSSSPSSSGGGGGGGGAASSAGETKTIKEIKAGTPASVTFTKSAVESVILDVKSQASNVAITVNEVSSPSAPLENVYKYLDIKAVNITDSNIKSAKISFYVSKDWLAGKDKNSVRLNRYSNGWSELATALDSENATDVKYTAGTPGFSTFAITAKPSSQPAQPSQQPAQEPRQPSQPISEKQETTNIGGFEVPKAAADYGLVIIILVLIIIAALGWLHYHSPWKVKKSKYEYKPKK